MQPKYLDEFAMLAGDVLADAGLGHLNLVLEEGNGKFKKSKSFLYYLQDQKVPKCAN